jgi:hypothetical protein
MAINFKKIWTGLTVVPKTASTSDSKGELEVIDASGKLQYHNGTSVSPVLTEAHSATITNKVIDADDNTISDLEVDNLKAGVLNTDLEAGPATDTELPSALAVQTLVASAAGDVQADVDDLITLSGVPANSTDLGTFTGTTIPDGSDNKEAFQALETALEADIAALAAHIADTVDAHDASAISNVPAGTIAATDVQAAINELDGDVQTVQSNLTAHINDATDAHDASAISNVPSGNLAATDVQGALNELQSDIDTRATDAALTAHIADTSTHGVTGDIVGTTDTQTLTNKTITGASIQTPTRLDVKQDTKANLETYALTATNGQLVFATDTKEMFQVVDNALVPVGAAGGDSDVDALIIQTFEAAALTDFTQTGLILDDTDPLHGEISAKLVHDAAINQSFKQIIPVDEKFRGANMSVTVTAKSSASSGNVTILFRDETNALDLQATQQINAGATPQTFQYGVTIPSDCLSFSYTITALPEAGSPETFIDDITIKNYWQGSALEGQTEYTFEVPVLTEWTSFTPTFTGIGTPTAVEAYYRQVGQNIEIIGKATAGTVAASIASFSIPSQFTIGAVPDITSSYFICGHWNRSVADSTSQEHELLAQEGLNVIYLTKQDGTRNPFTTQNGNIVLANSESFTFSCSFIGANLSATESKTVVINDLVPARSMPANASIEVPIVTEWQSYTPTFQGFGTPTAVEMQWRQVGENIEIRGKFTAGTVTAVEARVGLPNSYTSADTSIIPSIQAVGSSYVEFSSTTFFGESVLIEPSVTYVTFGRVSSTTDGTVKSNANSIGVTGADLTLFASIPVDGLTATETKTWTATQAVVTEEADSMVQVNTTSGYGSTGTRIRRFSNLVSSIGSDITYVDSATDGASFTVNSSGIYSVSYTDSFSAAGQIAISKNQTLPLTTNAASLGTEALAAATSSSVDIEINAAWTGYLEEGDILRPVTNGTSNSSSPTICSFTVAKQGSLSLVQTVADQKIEIPTSELKFSGASAKGAVATDIVKFDNIALLRGDAFTITNTANDGTYVTMNKSGILSVQAQIQKTTSNTAVSITKNQSILTGFTFPASEALISQQSNNANSENVSATAANITVIAGDIIRVASNTTPTANAGNNFALFFMEKDIAVAVTNVLPQFSDSDSYLELTSTSYSAGSTNTSVRRFGNVISNIGSDVLYTDSATDGATFTVRSDGLYAVSFTETSDVNTTALTVAISKNTSILTSIPSVLQGAIAVNGDRINTAATNTKQVTASGTVYCVTGDIIRAHSLTSQADSSNGAKFTISKVGKPNVTGVDVTPFANVSLNENQYTSLSTGVAFSGSANVTGSLTSSTGSGLFSYNSTTGVYTVLKKSNFYLSYRGQNQSASAGFVGIDINGVTIVGETAPAVDNTFISTSWVGILQTGNTFSFRVGSTSVDNHEISVLATTESENIVTPTSTFSTDTASLTYAGSGTYTLSTLANAPVGTFITFTYATSTNTRTQTNTAPTQTTSSMNANGIQLFARAYNAASTATSPSTIAIQIGKGLKGVSVDFYKSTSKVTSGSLDALWSGNAKIGTDINSYDETTGILFIDPGYNFSALTTTATFLFSDATFQTNGYAVINASKNPALTGFNTSKVYLNAEGNAGQVITTSTTDIPFITVEDTHGAWDGDQYTIPESGMYTLSVSCAFTASAARAFNIYINGSNYRRFNFVNASQGNHQGSYTGWFTKGQILSIRETNSGGTLNNSTSIHYLTISKV